MFWACTHVTLRNVELHILAKAGFEVLPEEVNVDVVSRADALAYDNPDLEINKYWRERTGLPNCVIDALRRSRLSERKGIISDDEKQLFNRYIDVIYIPSFLDIAVNVRHWFRGEVIFRYFGSFANLSSIKEMVKKFDRSEINNIYCLPIFETLEDHGVAEYFSRWSVMHSAVDAKYLPPRWTGIKPDQAAAVIMSPAHTGEGLELVRALLPLAKQIPILLLGRNKVEDLPADIREAFQVAGELGRDAYFAKFSSARFIIYPNASSYHMNYIPLEAIGAGIPLICRETIPLIKEYRVSKTSEGAEIGGVSSSHSELMAMAEALYKSPDLLPVIAQSQLDLLNTFSPKLISKEAKKLARRMFYPSSVGSLQDKLSHTLYKFKVGRLIELADRSVIAKIPNVSAISAMTNFVECGGVFGILNLHPSFGDISISRVEGESETRAGAELAGEGSSLTLMLGTVESGFSSGVMHEVEVRAFVQSDAALFVQAEIWIGGEIVQVWSGIHPIQRAGTPISPTLRFVADRKIQVLLTVKQLGAHGSILVYQLAHRTLSAGTVGDGWSDELIVPDRNYAANFWDFERINALKFAEQLGPVRVVYPPERLPVVGVAIDGSVQHVLRLSDKLRCIDQGMQLALNLLAEGKAELRTVLEYWNDDGLVGRSCHDWQLLDGDNCNIVVPIPSSDKLEVVPMLFLEAHASSKMMLIYAHLFSSIETDRGRCQPFR